MISIDYTVLIQMVNFLLLIVILNFLLYKPILGIMDRRKKQMHDTEEEITGLNKSVEERIAAYEEKLRQAKTDALEKKIEIIKEGGEEAKGLIEAAKSQIPGMMEQFHGEMSSEVTTARSILTGQSRNISIEIAEKLLGRSLR